MSWEGHRTYSRRSVLRAGVGATARSAWAQRPRPGHGTKRRQRTGAPWPGSPAHPPLPVGQYTAAFPFDHLVLVMQENHSFDNYLGMLPVSGQPLADGTFNKAGEPVNWDPVDDERMYVYHQPGDNGARPTPCPACSRAIRASRCRRRPPPPRPPGAEARSPPTPCEPVFVPAFAPRFAPTLEKAPTVGDIGVREKPECRGRPRGRSCRRGGRNAH